MTCTNFLLEFGIALSNQKSEVYFGQVNSIIMYGRDPNEHLEKETICMISFLLQISKEFFLNIVKNNNTLANTQYACKLFKQNVEKLLNLKKKGYWLNYWHTS